MLEQPVASEYDNRQLPAVQQLLDVAQKALKIAPRSITAGREAFLTMPNNRGDSNLFGRCWVRVYRQRHAL